MRKLVLILVVGLTLGSQHVAAAQEPDRLTVIIRLRAALNDGIDICAADFGARERDEKRALSVGRGAIAALGFSGARVEFDAGIDSKCVFIRVPGPLTEAGPRSYERVFAYDPGPLERYAASAGYLALNLQVCYPAVRVEAEGSWRGGDAGCEQRGLNWTGSGLVRISFRATGGTLVRGFLGSALFWLLIMGACRVVAAGLRRNDRWSWFVRHPVLGWFIVGTPVAAISLFWGFFVPYWTNLVASLQLIAGVGIPGEIVVTGVPPLVFAGGVLRARDRGISAVIARHPELHPKKDEEEYAPEALRPLDEPEGEGNRRGFIFFLTFTAVFGFLFLIRALPLSAGLKAGIPLVIGIGLSIPTRGLADRLTVVVNQAHLIEDNESNMIRNLLQRVGVRVRHVYGSVDLILAGREPGLRRFGGPATASLGGGQAVLWDRVRSLRPTVVAGGLVDGMGASPLHLLALVYAGGAAAIQAETEKTPIPWLLFLIPAALAGISVAADLLTRGRTLRAVASSGWAHDALRGILYFRRIEARSVTDVRPPPRTRLGKVLRRGDAGELAWRRTLKAGQKFATQAGISTAAFEVTAAEVLRMDQS